MLEQGGIQAEVHTMPPVMFINDVRRTDKQKGVFAELSVDMSETSELTIGARWYDIAGRFRGKRKLLDFLQALDQLEPHRMISQRFGTNLSGQYNSMELEL